MRPQVSRSKSISGSVSWSTWVRLGSPRRMVSEQAIPKVKLPGWLLTNARWPLPDIVVPLGMVSGWPEWPSSRSSVRTQPEMSAGSAEVLANSIQSVLSQLTSLRTTSALAAGAAAPSPTSSSRTPIPQDETALTDTFWLLPAPGCTGENPDYAGCGSPASVASASTEPSRG